MYNSSLGGQLGVMTTAYFKLDNNDTISPASSLGLTASYFTSKSYFGIIFNKMYFKEDNYRTKSAIGGANINFQTYVDIPALPNYPRESDDGVFVNYTTQFVFIYLEGTKRVWNDLFVGVRFMYTSSSTVFHIGSEPTEEETLFGFGIASEFDNRNSVFNPKSGQNAKLGTFTFLEELGSSSQYNKVELQYNKYFPVSYKTTILARAYAVASIGSDVPFAGKNIVGKDDLRGYSNGKFRANQVYDLQTELRWNFYKKWGMVAFGGVAVATDNFNGDNYSGLLPALGVGVRFKAIESKNINIGIDVAKGVNDWGLYFRIGEAFTR